MPKGDRTGPMGAGSKSGHRAGYCAGFNMPGYANSDILGGLRMGMARRRGQWSCTTTAGGRGWRNRFFAGGGPSRIYSEGYPTPAQPYDPELEKEFLKNRSQTLQSELEAINRRLKDIDPNVDKQ